MRAVVLLAFVGQVHAVHFVDTDDKPKPRETGTAQEIYTRENSKIQYLAGDQSYKHTCLLPSMSIAHWVSMTQPLNARPVHT
jgi:hypothetical protein